MLLLVISVFLSSLSQILLKKSAEKMKEEKRFLSQYMNVLVIVGYGILLISMLIPLYVLRFVDLKYVAVMESIGYIFIMILSALFLREKITKRMLIGNFLIVIGVILFGATII